MLEEKKKAIFIFIIIGLGIAVGFWIPMLQCFYNAGHQEPFNHRQLSFSGEILKDYQSGIKDFWYQKTGQQLDYGFMIGQIMVLFGLNLRTILIFKENSFLWWIAKIISHLGPMSGFVDMIENMYILFTLENPYHFNNIFAQRHSICALIKLVLAVSNVLWLLLVGILLRNYQRREFPKKAIQKEHIKKE